MARSIRIATSVCFIAFGVGLIGFLTALTVNPGPLRPQLEWWLGGILTGIFGGLSLRKEILHGAVTEGLKGTGPFSE